MPGFIRTGSSGRRRFDSEGRRRSLISRRRPAWRNKPRPSGRRRFDSEGRRRGLISWRTWQTWPLRTPYV